MVARFLRQSRYPAAVYVCRWISAEDWFGMMKRRSVLGLLAGGMSVLTLGGCGGNVPKLRYRLTVEVDTPNGVKTGSSVLEDAFNPGNSYEFSASRRTYGEAPTVDLGGGRYLFALLADPTYKRSMQNMISRIFDYPEYPSPVKSIKLLDRFAEANDSKPLIVIKPEDYPMLVTFDDIKNPKSVKEFDPGRVRRITVQVVDEDEPLTTGIEERLSWLSQFPEPPLEERSPTAPAPNVGEGPLAQQIKHGAFIYRGEK
tara:strand:+ start:77513 stop:78283 length:771 start_codon:yes stop_codon:yes gene_type:complete